MYIALQISAMDPTVDLEQAVQMAQERAEEQVDAWRQTKAKPKERFAIEPPLSPSEIAARKHVLRVYIMPPPADDIRSFRRRIEPFLEKHANWDVQFWLQRQSANAVSLLERNLPFFPAANDVMTVNAFDELPLSFSENDFYQITTKHFRWRGQLPGIPVAFRPSVLMYDSHVLQQLDEPFPNPSWTMEDVLDAAERIATHYPLKTAYAPHDGYEVSFLLEQEGIRLFTPALQPEFTNPRVIEELKRLRQIQRGRAIIQPFADSILTFSLLNQPSTPDMNAIALTPRAGAVWPMAVFYTAATRQSQHPDMAWEWAAFTARHPDIVASNALPALKSLAEDEATRARLGPERYDAYMTMLERVPPRSLTDADILKGAALWWFDQALRLVGPDTDLRAALAPAQDKAQAFLTCTGPQISDLDHLTACARQVDPDHPLASQAP